jgi:hypothetical protein
MALSKFVSAEWQHDELMDTYSIKATGDDGLTYWIPSLDTDVPPWPDYLAEGGVVTGMGPPAEKEPPA